MMPVTLSFALSLQKIFIYFTWEDQIMEPLMFKVHKKFRCIPAFKNSIDNVKFLPHLLERHYPTLLYIS